MANQPRGHFRVVAGMVASMVLAAFAVYSAGSTTHGFVSYYTASRLLVDGKLGPAAYDDRWFGEAVQRLTRSNIREIFIPNPPTMSLMALPIVSLDAQTARAVWLLASLAAFLAGVAALLRARARRNAAPSTVVLMLMMLMPAVFTNLRVGQGYLMVFGLFAATTVLLLRRRDRLAGVCLGMLIALKTSGVALVLLLVVRRRWTALLTTAITAVVLAVAITPFIDWRMWTIYPAQVNAYVERPASAVTAYQTTLSLVRHLCVADPQWNPSPAANCAPIAFVLPGILVGLATVVTLIVASASAAEEPWLAAGAALSVLSLPAVEEPHFVLMAIPLALLPLDAAALAVVGLLLIVPLEITAERFGDGWWALLAYPRLYASWLLWAVAVRRSRAGNGPVFYPITIAGGSSTTSGS